MKIPITVFYGIEAIHEGYWSNVENASKDFGEAEFVRGSRHMELTKGFPHLWLGGACIPFGLIGILPMAL